MTRRRKTEVLGVTSKGDMVVRFGNGRRTRRGRDRARAELVELARDRRTFTHAETLRVFALADDAGGTAR